MVTADNPRAPTEIIVSREQELALPEQGGLTVIDSTSPHSSEYLSTPK